MSDAASMVLGFVVATAIATVATPVTIRVALRIGFVDAPQGWKTHVRPTPCLGGLAILLATVAGVLAAGTVPNLVPLLVAAGALFAVGVVDDRIQLTWAPRAAVEVAAGLLLWDGGWGWHGLGPDWVEAGLTGLWVFGVVNAVNLLDLLDGLCAATVAASALATGALAALDGHYAVAVVPFALAGACLAFLPYNLARPARSFLGDSGTMFIGAMLAAAVMRSVAGHGGGLSLDAAVLLVGIPLLDLVFRAALRLRHRIPLMQAQHDSLADRLLERVGSARTVSLLAALAQLTAGLVAALALEAGGPALPLAVASAAGTGLAVAWALRARKRATR
jgi:UDP-GlcNAc:undecaprenyl-phosphate/decaprenyl-phosphate GlcNAc-1-phosphate transferase